MEMRYKDSVVRALEELQRAKRQILADINQYPTPISGCDAQFNHLLSTRTQITDAIDALTKPVFVPTPRQLEETA